MTTSNTSLLPSVKRAWDSAVPFQIEDAEFAAKNNRLVLGHKTGLGKTFISLLAWSQLNVERALILGTLASAGTWRRILRDWGGAESTFIQGYDAPNWKVALRERGIYLMTYATFRGLMAKTQKRVPFDLVVNDELHRVLRSRKTEVFKSMLRLDYESYFGLSATWSSRGPQDIWPVLHLIDKQFFSSYWQFVNTFCFVEKTTFGTEIFGVRNAAQLRRILFEKYYRARLYKDVASQFIKGDISEEPVVRRVVELPMSKEQKNLYQQLHEDMIAELNGTTVVTPTSLARLTRLLQIAVCPQILFPDADPGCAIEYICDKVKEDPHTVVFCSFAEAFPFVKAAVVRDGYPEENVFTLQGGIHPDDMDDTIARWKQCRGLILCTISFAQSFALDTTDTGYMLGFDWDPNNNIQAEGRLRRFDSILQTPCMVQYLVPEGSEYQKVEEVVNGKVVNTKEFLYGYGKAAWHEEVGLEDT